MKKSNGLLKRISAIIVLLCSTLSLACSGGGTAESVPPAEYTVSFHYDDQQQSVRTSIVTEGNTVSQPKTPEKEGYKFYAWYYMGEVYDFSLPVTENISLTAFWFDLSKTYRVTTGVESVFKGRGTAVLKGKNTTTAKITEGDEVTFLAIPSEGYAFTGWVTASGSIMSTEAEFTIPHVTAKHVTQNPNSTDTTDGELLLTASFAYSKDVSGLEVPENKALWNAIQNTNFNQTTIEASVLDNKTGITDKYILAVNKKDGIAAIEITSEKNGLTVSEIIRYYLKYENNEVTLYQLQNGKITQTKLPETFSSYIGELFKETSEDDALQMQLAVYNLLMHSVSQTKTGFSFQTNIGEYLSSISKFIQENGSLPVSKAAYSYLNDTYTQLIESITSKYGQTIANQLTKQTIGDMMGMITNGGEITVQQIDDFVYSAIDGFANLCQDQGLTFNATNKKTEYTELKKLTINQAIAKLSTYPVGGSIADVPSEANTAIAALYMLAQNYTVNDVTNYVVSKYRITGSDYDVTNPNANFSAASAVGNIITENGTITEIYTENTFGSGEESTKIHLSLKTSTNVVIPTTL